MCHHLFPVLQIQHAVFNNLLALSGGSGTHTVASSSVRKNAGRWPGSVAAFSSRVSNSFLVSDIVSYFKIPRGLRGKRAE
jgi:hypothetical protein